MTTFDPRQFFRVEEKFFPAWALNDEALDTPGLLAVYMALWHSACRRERPTQAELAKRSKCGLRALQGNLQTLEKRGYIVVRKHGGHNMYDLALSPHVVEEFLRQGVEFPHLADTSVASANQAHAPRPRQPKYIEDAQDLRMESANSAHLFKNLKEIKDTPPPFPLSRTGSRRTALPAQAARRMGVGEPSSRALSPHFPAGT